MSPISAPVEEAPVTGLAQLDVLPLASCVERQRLGELPMRFGRPGDGEAAAIEADNIRLTALLDAYECAPIITFLRRLPVATGG